MRIVAALLGVLLCACEEEGRDADEERSTVAAPTDDAIGVKPVAIPDDDGFVYAQGVGVVGSHVPTRFDARLPIDAAALDTSALPFAFIESRLCTNDPAMRERVVDAMRRYALRDAYDPAVVDAYSRLLGNCPSAAHCAWLIDVVESGSAGVMANLFASATAYCEHPRVGDLLVNSNAPHALILWHRANIEPTNAGLPVELARAVRQVIIDESQAAFADAAIALARYPGNDVAGLLAELQSAQNRAWTNDVDPYDYGDDAPELLPAACEYLLLAPQCRDPQVSDTDVIVAGSEMQYRQALLDPKRAAKANFVLAACVRDPEQVEPRRQHCLARLAERDWAQAKLAVEGITANESGFDESLRIVAGYESRAAFRRELADHGLVGDHDQPTFQETLSVVDELVRARRIFFFGGRSGTIPARHDALLFGLAGLAGEAMADVVFEELVLDAQYDGQPYVLRAYADGKRWSVHAEPIDDFYAVAETIGLLNVVAAERGSDLRWAALRNDTQYAVIVGPRDGIRRAVDRGLIALGEL